jgi:hypothetical protein
MSSSNFLPFSSAKHSDTEKSKVSSDAVNGPLEEGTAMDKAK